MRVNPNFVPDIIADLQQSQTALNTATQQVATGKSVNMPSDNPYAAATMVQNTIETTDVDQYTQNASTISSQLQTADSALSTVVTSLTSAISLGTEGANGTSNASNKQALATQIQGLLATVVQQANTTVGGVYLFGGTSTSTPYTEDSASPTGYTYNGNDDVNSVAIGDGVSVQVNLPGSQIFSNANNNVIGSLSSLVTALQSGSDSDIESATTAVSSALSYVGQQQVVLSNSEAQVNSQQTALQQDTVTLASQQNTLIGVNEATAALNLSQAETDNSAALAAAAKVLPNTLLNYLSGPS
jgi:flagellar hook-associated protein 3 FlgL